MRTSFTMAALAATYFASCVTGQKCIPDQDPSSFKSFIGEVEGGEKKELYLKGRGGKALCTNDDQIIMGDDNRAFILTSPNDDSRESAFEPDYKNGKLTFDVDVSSVGCNCATGVFLVDLDGKQCSWRNHRGKIRPKCP